MCSLPKIYSYQQPAAAVATGGVAGYGTAPQQGYAATQQVIDSMQNSAQEAVHKKQK